MPHRVELLVPATAAGGRLDAWLAAELHVPRARAAALAQAGAVLVDGRRAAKSTRLRGGERIAVEEASPDQPQAVPPPLPEVVWEDEHLLVVDKPPGLVVHPAPGHRGQTLVEMLGDGEGASSFEPRAVHRLDRDTSGLMLVAKGEPAQRQLQAVLRRREVEREYLALAGGRLESRTGTIDAPIGRDPRRRTRMSTVTDKPREARTHFEVERVPGRIHARAGAPRDGANASDPGPFRRDRASARRGPGVRRAGPCPGWSASSCTAPGSRSTCPGPASATNGAPSLPADLRAALEAALQGRGTF